MVEWRRIGPTTIVPPIASVLEAGFDAGAKLEEVSARLPGINIHSYYGNHIPHVDSLIHVSEQ
jgi:hypothetical protein